MFYYFMIFIRKSDFMITQIYLQLKTNFVQKKEKLKFIGRLKIYKEN